MRLAERFLALPAPVRRLLSVLVLAGMLLAVWLGGVAPLLTLAGSQARWRLEVSKAVAGARGEVRARPALAAAARALPQAPVWQRFYPNGPGEGAESRLRQDVSGLLSASGASVESLIPLPAHKEGPLVSHGIRLSASLSIDQLEAFLVALRAHPRHLRVLHLGITAPLNQTPYSNPPLTVQADVVGFSRAFP